MGLNKIDKPEPLAKTAFKALRHSILTNELTTGVVYNEKSLANDLGISRTPVREALLELSSKRLVKFLPQKGVIINTFTNEDINDVFEIRIALELFSIKKICQNQASDGISRLIQYTREQKQAAARDDKIAFMEADINYHLVFTSLTNNKFLMEMMQDIRDIMNLMGFKSLDLSGRMDQIVREHETLLNAISKADADTAAEQMISHLEAGREAVKRAYQSTTDN